MVAVLVRRVRVSGSLALRGGAARQLRVYKAHVANSRSECAVCSVTPRLLSTQQTIKLIVSFEVEKLFSLVR